MISKFFNWISTKSIAHLFAITRLLERDNEVLRAENKTLKQELSDLRKESVQKIYQAVGLTEPIELQNTAGLPIEVAMQASVMKSTTPITDLVKQAEEEAWIKWQESERQRLLEAQQVYHEFHNLD